MRSYGRGLIDALNPAVERPSAKTTVWRPLLLVVLLVAVAFVTAVAAAAWLLNAARIVGALWIGPALIAVTFAYGVQSIQVWPPALTWKATAHPHKVKLLWLLGIGAAALLLYATGNWPAPRYPGGQVLWWTWQFYPLASSTEADFVIVGLARDYVIAAATFVWARVIFLAALPVALPYAVRLLWYRYGVEIVYPTWADDARPRGLRWLDPMGLLDIHLPEKGDTPPVIVSAYADDAGL